jgi:UDP-N-acetylmuramoylalanine--D-glutamate ligase
LIHQILKTSIKNNVVTGNIAINPMLDVLSKIKINSWPVLELSSWHLEIMGDYKISPHIAVVTNVLNDHLNRYKNFAEYKKAKEVILKYQTKKDKAILNADNLDSLSFTKSTLADTYFYSLKKSSLFSSGSKNKGVYLENNKIYFKDKKQSYLIMDTAKIKILGQHNLSNILAAVCVAKIVGISNQNISKAVNNFKGVKYRLEHKANLAGLDIYNDSASTTPDAALAAIEAMGGRKIILIAGGQDKKLDYDKLARKIKSKVAYTVLLAGSGSDKLKKELHKIKYSPANMATDITSLKKAWAIAWQQKNQGELILFSPAATSFNMFKNEFDRARQFDALIYDKQKKKK